MLTVAGKGLIISETFDVKTRCTKFVQQKVRLTVIPDILESNDKCIFVIYM